jgi:predicted amidophosphoribosyltransferase
MASFKIVKLNFHYVSHNESIDKTDGICKICNKSFTTSEKICVGKCKHAFHDECLNKINRVSCPIDNIMWIDDYSINNL